MSIALRSFVSGIAVLLLASPALAADVGQDSIDACIDQVRARSGGGGSVLSTEFSEANSFVVLQDSGGTVWNCLVSNDGSWAELTMVGAAGGGAGGGMGGSGPGRWRVNVSDHLNIHSGPSTNAPVVARLSGGMIVENRGCTDAEGRSWCEIADGDASGWAAAEFLVPADGEGAMADDGGGAMAGAPTSGGEPSTGTQVVRFPAGQIGTDLSGVLSPGESVRYVLGAREGQDLSVEFWTTDAAIEYQILLPDGSFLLDRMANTQRYGGSLFMNGDHVIEVINRSGAAASYNLSVEIR